jgi:hypothetical protein
MNTKTKVALSVLFFYCSLFNYGFSQDGAPESNHSILDYPTDLGIQNYLAVTPDFDRSTRSGDQVTVEFTVKNNFDQSVELLLFAGQIQGLAVSGQEGKIRWIQNFRESGKDADNIRFIRDGGKDEMILKPGQTCPLGCTYDMDVFRAVAGRKVFGVITGRIVGNNR